MLGACPQFIAWRADANVCIQGRNIHDPFSAVVPHF